MPQQLQEQVRQIKSHLSTITEGMNIYQSLDYKEIPEWAEKDYYHLVDLVTTAMMVAHRLEKRLDSYIEQTKGIKGSVETDTSSQSSNRLRK